MEDKIFLIIFDLIQTKQSFTAWNVTQQLRKEHPDVTHGLVKKVVERLFFDGEIVNYTREIAANIKGLPWIYRPKNLT